MITPSNITPGIIEYTQPTNELVSSLKEFQNTASTLEKTIASCAHAKLDCTAAQNEKRAALTELNEEVEAIRRLFQNLIKD